MKIDARITRNKRERNGRTQYQFTVKGVSSDAPGGSILLGQTGYFDSREEANDASVVLVAKLRSSEAGGKPVGASTSKGRVEVSEDPRTALSFQKSILESAIKASKEEKTVGGRSIKPVTQAQFDKAKADWEYYSKGVAQGFSTSGATIIDRSTNAPADMNKYNAFLNWQAVQYSPISDNKDLENRLGDVNSKIQGLGSFNSSIDEPVSPTQPEAKPTTPVKDETPVEAILPDAVSVPVTKPTYTQNVQNVAQVQAPMTPQTILQRPELGTESSPLQTAGLSAVPDSITVRPDYTGTTMANLTLPSQGQQNIQSVMYSNDMGQTVVVTEVNGEPTTYVPPGFRRSSEQISTTPGIMSEPQALAEGGSVGSDRAVDAMYRMASQFLGYKGPKTRKGLEEFAKSSPGAASKMKAYTSAMAKGGLIRGYAPGGDVTNPVDEDTVTPTVENAQIPATDEPPTPAPITGDIRSDQLADMFGNAVRQTLQPMQATTAFIQPEAADFIAPTAGMAVPQAPFAESATVGNVEQSSLPQILTPSAFTPTMAAPAVAQETANLQAAQGQVSDKAQVTAAQGDLSKGALAKAFGVAPERISQVISGELQVTPEQLAEAATALNIPAAELAKFIGKVPQAEVARFGAGTPEAIAQDQFTLTPTQIAKQEVTKVQDAAKAAEMPTAQEARTNFQSILQAAQGSVGAKEFVSAKDIIGASKAIETVAATMSTLDSAAVASAAQGTFSQQALAKVQQGEVTARSTVQGQMSELMNQFNDGTPAWAAGAVRAANAAMSARGLGGSSMAGAAIVQAAMESAIPIAAQDAQTFAQMNLTNLNNRQQVALTNSAAQQNLELSNLGNRQQAALQNSSNAFALQSQNLSNSQAVVLANAQLKASFREKTLNISTQAAITNAARYAESNNINLNNQQQANLQRSAENLQVNMANLSNSQQTALANLQVRASLVGQELSNEQQMAMLQSSQDFDRAGFNANAKQQAFVQDAQARAALEGRALDARQQTALFNVSSVLQERGIELNNEQQTNLFNTSNNLQVDMANLSNLQQTYLANAQIEASLRGQELTNAQQTAIVNAGRFSEAANITFTAEQQAQLHNSELLKTVGITELNANQATALQNAATLANLDMANLNNRQQAAVQNAQSFLQMDLTNLNNEQQTALFKTQQNIQSLFTDQAAENASLQFNAASENQTKQFFSNLTTQVSQFNATQRNAMDQFNVNSVNAMRQFNSEVQQQRDLFNAESGLVIAQANAQWRQNIATLNNATQNESNTNFAKTINGLTQNNLDQIWQRERDIMSFAVGISEGDANRNLSLLLGEMEAQIAADGLKYKDNAARAELLLTLADTVFRKT